MARDAERVEPLKRRRGRPKGSKDRQKRARRTKTVFDFKVGGRNLTELAAAGRAIDTIGLLRFVQAEIVMTIMKELDSTDLKRRASLCDAFQILHQMEIESVKAKADIQKRATTATQSPQKPGSVEGEVRTIIKLDEFRTRNDPE